MRRAGALHWPMRLGLLVHAAGARRALHQSVRARVARSAAGGGACSRGFFCVPSEFRLSVHGPTRCRRAPAWSSRTTRATWTGSWPRGAAARFRLRDQEGNGARAVRRAAAAASRLASSSNASTRAGAPVDARRVLKTAAAGQSLVFFPEGTFTENPQIGKFLRGAFATAARGRCRSWPWQFTAPGSFCLRERKSAAPQTDRFEVLEVLHGAMRGLKVAN